MTNLFNIDWAFPYAFGGLLLLGLFIYGWYRLRKRRTNYGVPGPTDKSLYSSWRTTLLPYLPVLVIVGLALSIIALANPQETDNLHEVNADGIDIYMVMDLSHSMLEKDFKPNRISVAKDVAKEFVQKRKNDRIGLVPFGREAFTQCPLTMDHDVVLKLIDKMKVRMLGDNTAIGMGLATAVNRLKTSKAESKVIILLTDGKNNVNEITPITAAELAAQFDIKVYTIGLTKARSYQHNYRNLALQELGVDEKTLKEVAQKTGGRYFRATSKNALREIYNSIDKLETTEMEVTIISHADLKYRYFLIPAIILLTLWFIASRTFLKPFLP